MISKIWNDYQNITQITNFTGGRNVYYVYIKLANKLKCNVNVSNFDVGLIVANLTYNIIKNQTISTFFSVSVKIVSRKTRYILRT